MQVESRTRPCTTAAELAGQIAANRAHLAAAADGGGLGVIASGTPVLGGAVPSPITEGPRQNRGNATFRGLHHEAAFCALHVHVEMADRERAEFAAAEARFAADDLAAVRHTLDRLRTLASLRRDVRADLDE